MKNKTVLMLLFTAIVPGFIPASLIARQIVLGQKLLEAANQDDRNQVVSLVGQSANVNTEDLKLKTTPLQYACLMKDVVLTQLLFNHGAQVNHQDWQGETALMDATWNNSPECVAFLLDHGADVNMVSRDGGTALFIAAKQGRDAILALLLQHGANPSVEFHGKTAVQVAADAQDYLMVKMLKKAGAK